MTDREKLLTRATNIVQEDWQLTDAAVTWLSFTHHAVFEVQHSDHTYILKMLSDSDIAPENAIEREYRILSALADVLQGIPTIVQNADSMPLIAEKDGYVYAVLYHKYGGTSPSNQTITPDTMVRLGEWLGNLHNAQIDTTNLPLIQLDWEGLFSERGVYHPGDENMDIFTDQQIDIMSTVTLRIQRIMEDIFDSEDDTYGLIHGDLLLMNLLLDDADNALHVLDFEYCGHGYYLYDLTPSLWQLKTNANYEALASSLWNAYVKVRPQVQEHYKWLETLIAGRQVASMRWVVANQQNPYVVGKVDSILAQRTAELSAFLDTGTLIRA
ncbi:MAG: phosphotransferase [Chloroflexota bacterium]